MSALTEQDFAFMTELERYDAFLKLYRSPEPADAETLSRLYRSADPLLPLILLQYLEDIPEKPAVIAILRLVETGTDVVARAARAAYQRSHYPGKPRLLKQLILSSDPKACRFAVRTLARAGFFEALPLILRELPDREPAVREEMIDGLRFLPDRRVFPVLAPLADSTDEPTRFLAVQVLGELQGRLKVLSASFFLKRAQDPSERVRRAALEALSRFPTRRVAPMILEAALRADEPEDARVRAIRALGSFPSVRWVRPLAGLCAESQSPSIRLSAEIALRAYPPRVLKKGLVPMLEAEDAALKRQAALLAAEFLGKDPDVRRRLFDLWRKSDEASALELLDALGTLGGPEAAALLKEAILRSPLLAYGAAAALARLRGTSPGKVLVELLADEKVPSPVRQALLDRWARRGPEENVKDELLPHLKRCLASPTTNIRYLALQTLAWYPLHAQLEDVLSMVAKETSAEIVRTASRQIAKGLGRDPMPLLKALADHPERGRLLGHMMRLLTSQGWDSSTVGPMLEAVRRPPIALLDERPETYFALFVHLLEQGAVTLQGLWPVLQEKPGRTALFLRMLASFMATPRRRYPPLPLSFLETKLPGLDAEARRWYYEALAEEGSAETLEALAAALLREDDGEARARGAKRLKARLLETPR